MTVLPDVTPPTPPDALSAVVNGPTMITLIWTAATDDVGVTGYYVERDQVERPLMPIFALAYTDSGLKPATTYKYRVRARDAAGNRGPYSNVATATTFGEGSTRAVTAASMGSSAVWPSGLPQRFAQDPGVQESAPDLMIETQMDVGAPKARRRYTAGIRMVQGMLILTKVQRAILDDFFVTTCEGGTRAFDWIHPITLEGATFRFVQNGLRYRQTHADAVDLVFADLQLRIMP